ncbi:HAD family hydrolase [Streptomyces sp. NPDC007088]|uniref:HAD family hydrolase n=1 Tax=Streptomyces sp. NPDC007088 TaxID=3364773 RepID=UPI0036A0B4B6
MPEDLPTAAASTTATATTTAATTTPGTTRHPAPAGTPSTPAGTPSAPAGTPSAPTAASGVGAAAAGPVVGFDLDMTLIDSRPGIGAVYAALAAETGVDIDVELVTSRLGPPLEQELANWFPAGQVAGMSERYRALYPSYAITGSLSMPGAREAMDAVRAAGGRVLVVTAKYEPSAALHLKHLGIEPDLLIGGLWAEAKGEALREHGASVYVGDHTGDVRGARTAGALSVAVATGPCDPAELGAAGADVVLRDLTEFPGWLARHVAAGSAAV